MIKTSGVSLLLVVMVMTLCATTQKTAILKSNKFSLQKIKY